MKTKRIIFTSIFLLVLIIVSFVMKNLQKDEGVVIPVQGTISAGRNHTVALKKDGTVVAAGFNDEGQCNVSEWRDIVQVSAGMGITLGLKSDGTVVATGAGDIQNRVASWEDIVFISAGYYAFGITKDGKIVSTARGKYEDVDIDDFSNINFVNESFTTAILMDNDNKIYSLVEIDSTKERLNMYLKSFDNAESVQANIDLCGVLDDAGNLRIKNLKTIFDIGYITYSNVAQFDLDFYTTIMLRNNGEVKIVNRFGNTYIFFNKYRKELQNWEDIISVECGGTHFIGLKSDGTLVSVGSNEYGECDVSEWRDIATEPLPLDICDD